MAKRKLRVFHNSEVGMWQDCHQMWAYAHVENLDTEGEAFYFRFGTAFHAGVEQAWLAFVANAGKVGLPALVERARTAAAVSIQEFSDAVRGDADKLAEAEQGWKALQWVLPNYLSATADDFERYEPVYIEHSGRAPVLDASGRPRHLVQDLTVDLVLYDKATGQLVLRENKTTGSDVRSFEPRLSIDPQLTGYLEFVRQQRPTHTLCGTPIKLSAGAIGRVQYDVVRSRMPSTPSVNKVKKNDGTHAITAALAERETATGQNQGLVSVAQIDTTAEIYGAALTAQELERGLLRTDAQRAKLSELEHRGELYFQRFEFNRHSDAEVARWRAEMWAETNLMEKVRSGALPATRNQHYCTGALARKCKYTPICRADTPETRALYVRKDPDEFFKKRSVIGRGEGPAAGGEPANDFGF